MAWHIAQGRELPVFYWGQAYFGVPEAYLLAGLFRVAGFHPWLVNVWPMVMSLALVPLVGGLAASMGGPRAGYVAAIFVALPPPPLNGLLVNGGGGFSLAFALQAAVLFCFVRALLTAPEGPSLPRWVAAGSLAGGFLCWVWQPAAPLLAVWLLLLLVARRELRAPAAIVRAVWPVAVGLAMPLVYNVANGWPTLVAIREKAGQVPGIEAILPIGSGLRAIPSLVFLAMGGGDEYVGGANPTLALLALASLPLVPVLLYRSGRRPSLLAAGALVLSVAVDIASAHATARHLVPAALVAYALAGVLTLGFRRSGHWTPIAVAAVTLVLGVTAWLHVTVGPVRGDVAHRASETRALVQALESRGLDRGYADYWSAYPVTYLSAERIVVAPGLPMVGGGRVDRYPPYSQIVESDADPRRTFLLLDDRCDVTPYADALVTAGATAQIEHLPPWLLLWDPRPVAGTPEGALSALRAAIASNARC